MKKTKKSKIMKYKIALYSIILVILLSIIILSGCSNDNNPVSGNGSGTPGVLVYDRGKMDSVKGGNGYLSDTLGALDFSSSDSIIITYSAKVAYTSGNPIPRIWMQTANGGSPYCNIEVNPSSWIYDGGIDYYDYRVAVKSVNCIWSGIVLGFRVYRDYDKMFVKNFKIYKK